MPEYFSQCAFRAFVGVTESWLALSTQMRPARDDAGQDAAFEAKPTISVTLHQPSLPTSPHPTLPHPASRSTDNRLMIARHDTLPAAPAR